MLYAPCNQMNLVGSNSKSVQISIGYPNDLKLFKIIITQCTNSIVLSDIAYMWFQNANGALRGLLANKTDYLDNNDNDLLGVNILSSSISSTALFSITSPGQSPGQTGTYIDIDKLGNAKDCLDIAVFQCNPDRPIANNSILFNTIYPNPASDFVQIQMPDESLRNGKIVVYDNLGVAVKTVDNIPDDVSEWKLDISDLPDGIYVISVFLETGSYTYKMIKAAN